MEADSTTTIYDNFVKDEISEPILPFSTSSGNLNLYQELSSKSDDRHIEIQIVERLQSFGLLPKMIKCPTGSPDCKVISKPARVIDRIQWVCEGCGKRQPIRSGSFFLRLQCSLLQALQLILAWCEDAECDSAAQFFGVKPRVANAIYDRMDELAIKLQTALKLGGSGVVLMEVYPDCQTRLSPDTTDHPHAHRVLMVADTNRIPTSYQLHVIKEDSKKNSSAHQSLTAEAEEVIARVTVPGSTVVCGGSAPALAGAASLPHLLQHCDADMQHFLTSRIWRQAITLCVASRELCAGAAQRYLHSALYRLRHGHGFFATHLTALAREYTERADSDCDNSDASQDGIAMQ